MKRFGRVDKNQKEIVDALREAGASVQSLATVGGGCIDLLVGFDKQTFIMEIKKPRGTFTQEQMKWFKDWNGSEIHIVLSKYDALKVIRGKR